MNRVIFWDFQSLLIGLLMSSTYSPNSWIVDLWFLFKWIHIFKSLVPSSLIKLKWFYLRWSSSRTNHRFLCQGNQFLHYSNSVFSELIWARTSYDALRKRFDIFQYIPYCVQIASLELMLSRQVAFRSAKIRRHISIWKSMLIFGSVSKCIPHWSEFFWSSDGWEISFKMRWKSRKRSVL